MTAKTYTQKIVAIMLAVIAMITVIWSSTDYAIAAVANKDEDIIGYTKSPADYQSFYKAIDARDDLDVSHFIYFAGSDPAYRWASKDAAAASGATITYQSIGIKLTYDKYSVEMKRGGDYFSMTGKNYTESSKTYNYSISKIKQKDIIARFNQLSSKINGKSIGDYMQSKLNSGEKVSLTCDFILTLKDGGTPRGTITGETDKGTITTSGTVYRTRDEILGAASWGESDKASLSAKFKINLKLYPSSSALKIDENMNMTNIFAAEGRETTFSTKVKGGFGSSYSYQWQYYDNDTGKWVNLDGGNTASFKKTYDDPADIEKLKLRPIRCVVNCNVPSSDFVSQYDTSINVGRINPDANGIWARIFSYGKASAPTGKLTVGSATGSTYKADGKTWTNQDVYLSITGGAQIKGRGNARIQWSKDQSNWTKITREKTDDVKTSKPVKFSEDGKYTIYGRAYNYTYNEGENVTCSGNDINGNSKSVVIEVPAHPTWYLGSANVTTFGTIMIDKNGPTISDIKHTTHCADKQMSTKCAFTLSDTASGVVGYAIGYYQNGTSGTINWIGANGATSTTLSYTTITNTTSKTVTVNPVWKASKTLSDSTVQTVFNEYKTALSKTYIIKAKDAAGNESTTTFKPFLSDSEFSLGEVDVAEGATNSVSVNAKAGTNYTYQWWYFTSDYLFSKFDDSKTAANNGGVKTSGATSKTISLSQATDTRKTIHAICAIHDNSGNGNIYYQNVDINVYDKASVPSVVTLKTADGKTYTAGSWTNQNVTASVKEDSTVKCYGSVGSGTNGYQYKFDNAADSIAVKGSSVTISETKSVQFRGYNTDWNKGSSVVAAHTNDYLSEGWTEAYQIKIDKEKPAASVTASTGDNTIGLSGKLTDSGSGLRGYQIGYKDSSGKVFFDSEVALSSAASKDITVNLFKNAYSKPTSSLSNQASNYTDATKRIYVIRVYDNAGNYVEQEITVLAAASIDNIRVASGGSASVTATASGSGCTYQWQYYKGSNWVNITSTDTGSSFGTFSGMTSATLKITNANVAANQLPIRCAITSNGQTVYTTAASPKGDVNGDGKVDNTDVTAITNYINGTTSAIATKFKENADVNGDNTINTSDKTAVTNIAKSGSTDVKLTSARVIVYGKPTITVSYKTADSKTYTPVKGCSSGWSNAQSGAITATVTASVTSGAGEAKSETCLVTRTYNDARTSFTDGTASWGSAVKVENDGIYSFTARAFNSWVTDSYTQSGAITAITTADELKLDTVAPTFTTKVSGGKTIIQNAADSTAKAKANAISSLSSTPYQFGTGSYTSNAEATYAANQKVSVRDVAGNVTTQTVSAPELGADKIDNIMVIAGKSGSVTASATGGSENYSYQWQYYNGSSWANITSTTNSSSFSGMTSATLTITNANVAANQMIIRCAIKDTKNTSASTMYTLGKNPKGDVNFDGVINNNDITEINNYLKNKSGYKLKMEAADASKDNTITSDDTQAIQKFLNKTSSDVQFTYARIAVFAVPTVSVSYSNSYTPAASKTASASNWTNKDVTATITANNGGGAGACATYTRNNETGTFSVLNDPDKGTSGTTRSYTTNGTNYIGAKAVNTWWVGSDPKSTTQKESDVTSSETSGWIKIDKNAPKYTGISNDGTSGKVTVTKPTDYSGSISPTTSESGLKRYKFSNGNWVTVSGSTLNSITNTTAYQPGDAVSVILEDNAGNQTTITSGSMNPVTPEPETTSVPVTITWDDSNNANGKRPSSVTVTLYANGSATGTITINSANGWKGTFFDMPKYNSSGKEIKYTVSAPAVDKYSGPNAVASDGGWKLTYTYVPDPVTPVVPEPVNISIPVSITWNDSNNANGKRPSSVVVTLYANGSSTGTITLRSTGSWSGTFTAQPKYDSNGKEIKYTVSAPAVDKYSGPDVTANGSGWKLSYTYVPDPVTPTPTTTSVPITVVWDDNNNAKGKRPANITISLLANGSTTKTATLQAYGNWKGTISNLSVYDTSGKEIAYTVSAPAVANYSEPVITANGTGWTVTYTYAADPEPVTTSVPVTVVWDDNNNAKGKRPTSVTVTLQANGSTSKTATLRSTNSWKSTFASLSVYDISGKEIAYTVSAPAVANYSDPVITANGTGWTITYTYAPDPEPEIASLTVSKAKNIRIIDKKTAAKINNTTDTSGTTSITANGGLGAYSYQWQYYNSSDKTWYDLSNTAMKVPKNAVDTTQFSGTKTATLTVSNASAEANQTLIRCKVTDGTVTVYAQGSQVKGDVNADGVLDNTDVTAINSYVSGTSSAIERKNLETADADMNDVINNSDITVIRNKISGSNSEPRFTYARIAVFSSPSTPSISFTSPVGYTEKTWTREDVTAKSNNAAGSGNNRSSQVEWKKDNAAGWADGSIGVTTLFTGTGKHTFTTRAYNAWWDNNSLISDEVSKEIWIDQIPPTYTKTTTTVKENNTGDGLIYTVTVIGASDSESGMAPEAYSFDGGRTWQTSNQYQYTSHQTIDIWIRDAAGNVTFVWSEPPENPTAPDTPPQHPSDPSQPDDPKNPENKPQYTIPYATAVTSDVFVLEGGSKSVTVTTGGDFVDPDKLTYQWQYYDETTKKWVNFPNGTLKGSTISGATSKTLTISNADTALDGTPFRCIVSDGSTTVISDMIVDEKTGTTRWPKIIVAGKPTPPKVKGEKDSTPGYPAQVSPTSTGTKPWTNANSVTLIGYDSTLPGDGAILYQYSLDGGKTWIDGTEKDAQKAFTAEGIHEIWFRAVNKEYPTLISDTSKGYAYIDRTKPLLKDVKVADTMKDGAEVIKNDDGSITIKVTNPEIVNLDTGVTITISGLDDPSNVGGDSSKVSGLADKPYSFDGGVTWTDDPTHTFMENGDYEVWIKDAAGNIAKITIHVEGLIDNVYLIKNPMDITGYTFGVFRYMTFAGDVEKYVDTKEINGTNYIGLKFTFDSNPKKNTYVKATIKADGYSYEFPCTFAPVNADGTVGTSDGSAVLHANGKKYQGYAIIDPTKAFEGTTKANVKLTLTVTAYNDAECSEQIEGEKGQESVSCKINIDTLPPTISYSYNKYNGLLQAQITDDLVGFNGSEPGTFPPAPSCYFIPEGETYASVEPIEPTISGRTATFSYNVPAGEKGVVEFHAADKLLNRNKTEKKILKKDGNIVPVNEPTSDPKSENVGEIITEVDLPKHIEAQNGNVKYQWKTRHFYISLINGNS